MTEESDSSYMLEVRKCLREADSYDPSLSDQEMLELYQVLKDSQKTANEEDEQRRIFEQTEANCTIIEELKINSIHTTVNENSFYDKATDEPSDVVCSSSEETMKCKKKEKPFTPKKWGSQKKQSKPASDFQDEVSSTSMPSALIEERLSDGDEDKDINVEGSVDVFNSVPTTHKPLKQICLNPKYSPPFYCNPKLTDLSYKQRACLISNFHLELVEKYNNYQRQSLIPAPWEKPIQSNVHFNGNLMKKSESPEEDTEQLSENPEVDQLLEAAKDSSFDSDLNEVYVSKSGRHTKRKLYSEDIDINSYDWKKLKPTVADEENTVKTYAKKRNIVSVPKDDIKRSKLMDTSSRTERMFDKLVEEDLRKEETEKKLEKFQETLDSFSETMDEVTVNIAEVVHSEEPFIRRRVVPPSLPKKFSTSEKNKTPGRPKGRQISGSKKSPARSAQYKPLDSTTSTGDGKLKQKAACPVCFEQFFQSELMEHTPACLDDHNQNSSSAKPSDFCQTRITCATCDKAFVLDMNYAEHVKECLEKQKK